MEYSVSKVKEIVEMGEGSRVEVDFIDVLGKMEGVLVGDTARGFVLVLAETRETATYPPRPFRVNAGSIHQYICVADGKTKYLSELKSGDRVLVTDGRNERYVTIGRIKIEKREFIQVRLENAITATLQKADSVHVSGNDTALHLLDVKAGDEMVVVEAECIARHKGEIIEETIEEK